MNGDVTFTRDLRTDRQNEREFAVDWCRNSLFRLVRGLRVRGIKDRFLYLTSLRRMRRYSESRRSTRSCSEA